MNKTTVIAITRVGMLRTLLFALLVCSCFVPMEILSAAMLIAVMLLLVDPFSRQRRLIFPGGVFFGVIIFTGLMGVVSGNVPYDIFKDVWYTGNAALTLFLGFMIAKEMGDLRPILRTFILAAVIVSAVHVTRFMLDPATLQGSLVDIRIQMGAGYLIAAIGLFISLAALRYHLDVLPSRGVSFLVIVLCLLSVALSLSRTLWVVVLTFMLVPFFVDHFKAAIRTVIIAGLVVIGMLTATSTFQTESATGASTTFVEKTIFSLQELRISDFDTLADVNVHWRGFESYRALQEYASGTPLTYLMGKGFGTNINLGFTMTLADEEFERIPILHNGYMYLLVKTGAIGLAAYLLYLMLVFRTGRRLMKLMKRSDVYARLSGVLLIGLTISMFETTLVIAGMFNKYWVYPATMFLGILMGYADSVLGGKSDGWKLIAPIVRETGADRSSAEMRVVQ